MNNMLTGNFRAPHGRAEKKWRGFGLAILAAAALAACGGGGGGGDTPQTPQTPQADVSAKALCPDGKEATGTGKTVAEATAAAQAKCAPARILSISPGNGESVPVNAFTGITFTMDGLLDPASTVSSAATATAPDGSTISADVVLSADKKAFTVTWPAKPVIYTLVVTIKDSAGHGIQITTTVSFTPAPAHYVWVVVRSGVGEGLSYLDFASGKEVKFVNKTGKAVFGFEEATPHNLPDGHLLMRPNLDGQPGQMLVDVNLDKGEFTTFQGTPANGTTFRWLVLADDYPKNDAKAVADGKTCYARSAGVPLDKQNDVVCTGMTFSGTGLGNVVNIIAVKVGG